MSRKYSQDVETLIAQLDSESRSMRDQITQLQEIVESHREPQEYRLCPNGGSNGDDIQICIGCVAGGGEDKFIPCEDSFLVKRI